MTDILIALYPWLKVLHLAAVISWMAGMFYLPRLFVYQVERTEIGSDASETFSLMQRKLLKVITTPAMIVTWIAGLALACVPGVIDWSQAWPYIKFIGVFLMSGCHGWLSAQHKKLAVGIREHTGRTYRFVNEAPTLLMLVILIAIFVRP